MIQSPLTCLKFHLIIYLTQTMPGLWLSCNSHFHFSLPPKTGSYSLLTWTNKINLFCVKVFSLFQLNITGFPNMNDPGSWNERLKNPCLCFWHNVYNYSYLTFQWYITSWRRIGDTRVITRKGTEKQEAMLSV